MRGCADEREAERRRRGSDEAAVSACRSRRTDDRCHVDSLRRTSSMSFASILSVPPPSVLRAGAGQRPSFLCLSVVQSPAGRISAMHTRSPLLSHPHTPCSRIVVAVFHEEQRGEDDGAQFLFRWLCAVLCRAHPGRAAVERVKPTNVCHALRSLVSIGDPAAWCAVERQCGAAVRHPSSLDPLRVGRHRRTTSAAQRPSLQTALALQHAGQQCC